MILCCGFVTAAANTLTVDTSPDGLEVWQEGVLLGRAPVVLEGPFTEDLEVTIKGSKYKDFNATVTVPGDYENGTALVVVGKKEGYSALAFFTGVSVGIIIPFAVVGLLVLVD